jgi:thiamine biosynthesis protein ThiC
MKEEPLNAIVWNDLSHMRCLTKSDIMSAISASQKPGLFFFSTHTMLQKSVFNQTCSQDRCSNVFSQPGVENIGVAGSGLKSSFSFRIHLAMSLHS